MSRSVVQILISTIRAQAETTLALEGLLAARSDEFSIARARRAVLDAALTAQTTADGAERLHQTVMAALPPPLSAVASNQSDPPEEPPPSAA